MKYGFGVDLGGTTVKLAFFDETGTMLEKWEIPTVTANNGSQILPDIAASVQKYLDEKKLSKEQLMGIGIGVPGPVEDSFTVNKCVNLGWGVFNIKERMNELMPEILAGPERIESGWWDGADRRRDYYVVRTRDGRLAWVWQAVDGQGPWMLHGWFA